MNNRPFVAFYRNHADTGRPIMDGDDALNIITYADGNEAASARDRIKANPDLTFAGCGLACHSNATVHPFNGNDGQLHNQMLQREDKCECGSNETQLARGAGLCEFCDPRTGSDHDEDPTHVGIPTS